MTSIDNPTYRLNALTFNAVSHEAGNRDLYLTLTDREAIASAVIDAFAAWLYDHRTVDEAASALTSHEVESASATGCEHHAHRDCQQERARLLAVRLAQMSGTST